MPRTPSARAHEQVLKAAARLFAERGLDATSMDAIAAAAGVSKATIYKHWQDKDALCIEVLSRLRSDPAGMPPPSAGDVRGEVVALLEHSVRERRSGVQNRMMPHLVAYACRNPEFAKAWRTLVMEPSRARLAELLKRAIAEGQLRPGLDLDLSAALLTGPMMYRRVLGLMHAKTPHDMAQRVVAAFWRAHEMK
ncbi:MAG: TetR/AcrR family transcriptional regulator [Bryobacteraceae bacterium]